MILQDCRVTISVIAHELGISAGTVSSTIHSVLMFSKSREWNMGPSSWSRDQTRVHAMETQGFPYSQKISCATIIRKDHGNSFLGLGRCSAFGIHSTQDNHYSRHLCFHIGGFTREYQTETPWKVVGWCPAASWQCTCSQVMHIAGCYNEMWLHRT